MHMNYMMSGFRSANISAVPVCLNRSLSVAGVIADLVKRNQSPSILLRGCRVQYFEDSEKKKESTTEH